MDAITFNVSGNPVPQPRVRFSRGGHAYTPDNGIRAYKQAIVIAAGLAAKRARWKQDDGPHQIVIDAVFARPPSHLTKNGTPRSSAPRYPGRVGDFDNLGKAVADAVTACGAIWVDDDQVVDGRIRKRYAAPGEAAGTTVIITRPPRGPES